MAAVAAVADGPREVQSAAPADLVEAVTAELAGAGRLGSYIGQQAVALALAWRDPFATAAAKASLSRELRAVMAEAMKGAHAAADPVDELRRKRDLKRAAG